MPVLSKHVPYDLGLRWSRRLHKAFQELLPAQTAAASPIPPSLMTCQEALARAMGHAHWHAYAANVQTTRTTSDEPLSMGANGSLLSQHDATPLSGSPAHRFTPLHVDSPHGMNLPASLIQTLTQLVRQDVSALHLEYRVSNGAMTCQARIRDTSTSMALLRGVTQEQLHEWFIWSQTLNTGPSSSTSTWGTLTLPERTVRIRAACLHTYNGSEVSAYEKKHLTHAHPSRDVVLSISEPTQAVRLDQLGHATGTVQTLEEGCARPEAMVVVSGPTRSGITSTVNSIVKTVQNLHRGQVRMADLAEEPHVVVDLQRDRARTDGPSPWQNGLGSHGSTQHEQTIVTADSTSWPTSKGWSSLIQPRPGMTVVAKINAGSGISSLLRLHDMASDLSIEVWLERLPTLILVHQRLMGRLCPYCSWSTAEALKHTPHHAQVLERLTRAVGSDPSVRERWHENVRWRASDVGCSQCHGLGMKGQTVCSDVFHLATLPPAQQLAVHAAVRHLDVKRIYDIWRSSSDGHLMSASTQGKTVMEHAMVRVLHGEIDPSHVEERLGPLGR